MTIRTILWVHCGETAQANRPRRDTARRRAHGAWITGVLRNERSVPIQRVGGRSPERRMSSRRGVIRCLRNLGHKIPFRESKLEETNV